MNVLRNESGNESGKESGFFGFACRYASRNIGRNRRRTVLTVGTITLSVLVSIVGSCYSGAILRIWEEGVINYGAGHAQLHRQGFLDHPDVIQEELTLAEAGSIEKALKNDPKVRRFARRLTFEGIISSGTKTIYFLGRAVEPDAELIVSPDLFNAETDAGAFVSDDDLTGIVVGKGLAESIGLELGHVATLMVHTMNGSVNAVDVSVRGIIDLPLPALSKRLVYVHLDQGQKAIELGGRYTELAVRLQDDVDVETWVKTNEAVAAKAGLSLRGWWETDPYIRDVERIWSQVIGVICLLLFVSAGISVLNIVFMLVAERTVEIGTLMAIGAKPKDIRILFTLEAGLFGVIGGVLGAGLGNLIVFGMNVYGMTFDSPFGSGVFDMHPQVSPLITAIVIGGSVFICYLSALAPARKAAMVEPVTAFRGQIT